MTDILQEIVAHKRVELQQLKAEQPERELHRQVERLMEAGESLPSMADALRRSSTGIIAEFKRRSPSKGWIKEEGRADVIPLSTSRQVPRR
jgi:indole-3-glycerol phosphate synthase